jgi:hypothetical protein
MLRPNVTCLSQISHLAICILPGRPGRSQFD